MAVERSVPHPMLCGILLLLACFLLRSNSLSGWHVHGCIPRRNSGRFSQKVPCIALSDCSLPAGAGRVSCNLGPLPLSAARSFRLVYRNISTFLLPVGGRRAVHLCAAVSGGTTSLDLKGGRDGKTGGIHFACCCARHCINGSFEPSVEFSPGLPACTVVAPWRRVWRGFLKRSSSTTLPSLLSAARRLPFSVAACTIPP